MPTKEQLRLAWYTILDIHGIHMFTDAEWQKATLPYGEEASKLIHRLYKLTPEELRKEFGLEPSRNWYTWNFGNDYTTCA